MNARQERFVEEFDLSVEDQRFLMIGLSITGSPERAEINVVFDWFEELTRLVPTP